MRAKLVKLATEKHVLLVTGHHLVCDGWTVNVMVDELGETVFGSGSNRSSRELSPVKSFPQYAQEMSKWTWRQQEKKIWNIGSSN